MSSRTVTDINNGFGARVDGVTRADLANASFRAEAHELWASHGGLLGISDNSGDVRDLEEAAAAGDANSQLALDVLVQDLVDVLERDPAVPDALGVDDDGAAPRALVEAARLVRADDALEAAVVEIDLAEK